MTPLLRIGTRRSKLALAQSGMMQRAIGRALNVPEAEIETAIPLVEIVTTGDRIQDRRLLEVGGKALFTKEIEEALLDGRVDVAIHSMKDVPAEQPDGLAIAAVPEREDARDGFISEHFASFADLPHGARLGTASLRRQAQALALRPDLHIEMLRGNIDTRLRRAADGEFDAILLAAAGLNSYRFSVEWARIEPERGFISRAMLDHYRRMIDTALGLGLDPTVTLMHFTVPQWFQKDGFWRASDAVDLFSRYVETVLPILEGVKYVCTINEPNIAAMLAGGEDAANLVAYGLPNPDLAVADTLLDAHHRASEILHSRSGIQAGWTIATQAFHSTGERFLSCTFVQPGGGKRRDFSRIGGVGKKFHGNARLCSK